MSDAPLACRARGHDLMQGVAQKTPIRADDTQAQEEE
jgi:hypothetical protein